MNKYTRLLVLTIFVIISSCVKGILFTTYQWNATSWTIPRNLTNFLGCLPQGPLSFHSFSQNQTSMLFNSSSWYGLNCPDNSTSITFPFSPSVTIEDTLYKRRVFNQLGMGFEVQNLKGDLNNKNVSFLLSVYTKDSHDNWSGASVLIDMNNTSVPVDI
jgi:hypothetical protein